MARETDVTGAKGVYEKLASRSSTPSEGQRKRAYMTPTLHVYGNLSDLTAAGSVNANSEDNSQPGGSQGKAKVKA